MPRKEGERGDIPKAAFSRNARPAPLCVVDVTAESIEEIPAEVCALTVDAPGCRRTPTGGGERIADELRSEVLGRSAKPAGSRLTFPPGLTNMGAAVFLGGIAADRSPETPSEARSGLRHAVGDRQSARRQLGSCIGEHGATPRTWKTTRLP
ncbi:MAG: hypothetical protein ACUVYA_18485 [Planctomycetota bacterium]